MMSPAYATQDPEPKEKEPEKDKDKDKEPPSPDEVQKLHEQVAKAEAKIDSAKQHAPGVIPPLEVTSIGDLFGAAGSKEGKKS
jgi:hypothetical protein